MPPVGCCAASASGEMLSESSAAERKLASHLVKLFLIPTSVSVCGRTRGRNARRPREHEGHRACRPCLDSPSLTGEAEPAWRPWGVGRLRELFNASLRDASEVPETLPAGRREGRLTPATLDVLGQRKKYSAPP